MKHYSFTTSPTIVNPFNLFLFIISVSYKPSEFKVAVVKNDVFIERPFAPDSKLLSGSTINPEVFLKFKISVVAVPSLVSLNNCIIES